jgi:RNA polymerase sigma-70 factor, ECF subfamily
MSDESERRGIEPESANSLEHPIHGREDRLVALFDSCYPRLARYAYARIGNRTDAEDIASEVFLRALESLGSYHERGLPMEAWLFRIAHNLVVDRLRRTSRFVRVEEPQEESIGQPDPAHTAEARIMMRDVRAAMNKLTPQQRDVITLRFFGGLDSREVAEIMHKSSGSVREMQRAALERLRGLLSP